MDTPIKNPVNERAMERLEKEFWERYQKAIDRAIALTKDRQESYIGEGHFILEGAILGEGSMLYEINKKNIRLKGLLKAEEKHGKITAQSTDSVEDTLLDLMNYAAFHIVYREMVKSGVCEISLMDLIKQENFDQPGNHHKWVEKMRDYHNSGTPCAPLDPAEDK